MKDRKPKEHNCLNCETAKKPGWKGNCGTCPPLEDSGVRARVREDASRALLTDAAKEVDRLRAEVGRLTKDLALNAKMLARQCDLARQAEAERMIVSDIESWKEKYERQCEGTKARMEENRRLGAEVARLTEISIHGCDCSQADACRFARERDEARAENAKLRADFPPPPPLPVVNCKCSACDYLRRKQKEDWDKREGKR